MPLYEYKCEKCETVSEFHMKMSDPHPESCPDCGAKSLRKLISQTAFQLKGDGWYSDGYSGKSNRKTENKAKSKDGDSSSSSTTSTSTSTSSESSSTPTTSTPKAASSS
ncbi:MAG: FmdB family zinc ribbon protein [Oligoflexus sp.]